MAIELPIYIDGISQSYWTNACAHVWETAYNTDKITDSYGEARLQLLSSMGIKLIHNNPAVLVFENEEDATVFKLRWS